MPNTELDYVADARDDAMTMALEFSENMAQALKEGGEVSDDYNNDYPNGDEYFHLNVVDRWYDLLEAATLLDQLSDHEETDYGLWHGLPPKGAVGVQAAYTYGNAVTYYWCDIVREVNADPVITDYLSDHENEEGESTADLGVLQGMIESVIRDW